MRSPIASTSTARCTTTALRGRAAADRRAHGEDKLAAAKGGAGRPRIRRASRRPASGIRRGTSSSGDACDRARATGMRADATATARRSGRKPAPVRRRPRIAITNARIHPITQPVIERGTIVIRGGAHRGARRQRDRRRPARRSSTRRAPTCTRLHRRAHGRGHQRARPARLRGRRRDARDQRGRAGARRRISGTATRSPSRGSTASPASPSIPGGGLLGGQIAVMNLDGWSWEQAAVKPVVGVSFQFPAIGGGGRGGGGGGGGQGQDRSAATRTSSASATRA